MKQALVLTLMFTLIFPAYCFASPTKDKSPIDENMVTEVMWILEDGVVDKAEMDDIASIYHVDETCEFAIDAIWSTLYGAMAGMILGGEPWNPSATYLMLYAIVNAMAICTISSDGIYIPIPHSPEP